MARVHAALLVMTGLGFGATSGSASAQVLSTRPVADPAFQVALPQGQTSGVKASIWAKALATGGRLPNHERMLVVSQEGHVLSVVEGERERVVLPVLLAAELSRDPLHVTLVHNHPDSVSLSGSDLIQLAKVGVERVIALGHDGTVYEAAAAAEFGKGDILQQQYGLVLDRVLERLTRESHFASANLSALYPHASHIVALIFDRAGVIRYAVRPSLDVWMAFERYRTVIQRAVDAEAARLQADLGLADVD